MQIECWKCLFISALMSPPLFNTKWCPCYLPIFLGSKKVPRFDIEQQVCIQNYLLIPCPLIHYSFRHSIVYSIVSGKLRSQTLTNWHHFASSLTAVELHNVHFCIHKMQRIALWDRLRKVVSMTWQGMLFLIIINNNKLCFALHGWTGNKNI